MFQLTRIASKITINMMNCDSLPFSNNISSRSQYTFELIVTSHLKNICDLSKGKSRVLVNNLLHLMTINYVCSLSPQYSRLLDQHF